MFAEPMSFAPKSARARTSKRGYLKTPQRSPERVSSVQADGWKAAERAYLDANAALQFDTTGSIPEDLGDACSDARDRMISTPAPHGQALALKLAAVLGLVEDGQVSPFQIARIANGSSEDDKALLACYLDALRLGVASPAAASLVGAPMANSVRILADLQDWRELREHVDQRDGSDGDLDALLSQLFALEERLYRLPCDSIEAALAKLTMLNLSFDRGLRVAGDEEQTLEEVLAFLRKLTQDEGRQWEMLLVSLRSVGTTLATAVEDARTKGSTLQDVRRSLAMCLKADALNTFFDAAKAEGRSLSFEEIEAKRAELNDRYGD